MPLTWPPTTLDPPLSPLTGECLPASVDTIPSTPPAVGDILDCACNVLAVAITGWRECWDGLRPRKRLALSRDRASVLRGNRSLWSGEGERLAGLFVRIDRVRRAVLPSTRHGRNGEGRVKELVGATGR